MENCVDFLRNTDIFSKVPEPALMELSRCMKQVEATAGTILFREGDPGDAAYLVMEGVLSVEKGGRPIVTRAQGELVGEMALLDNTARSSDVIAKTDVRLLRLESDDFHRIFTESREVATGIFRTLTDKLRQHTAQQAEPVLTVIQPGGVSDLGTTLLLQPGSTLADRYWLERKCGQGGMGIVFKAVDQMLRIPVALKILISLDSNMLERFKREVVLARKVVHPNTCRIFDIGECEGLHYVSMEFMEGETLGERLRRRFRLGLAEALPVLRDVLLGLDAIHQAGIVHRDLKPGNIMICADGKSRIMDFGIASCADVDLRLTQTGQFIGTPYYSSPEQIQGSQLDGRADLYSMGVILFEVFTGRLPFATSSAVAVLSGHLNSPPPDPTQFAGDMPRELATVILKALEKDPQDRYQNAPEFLAAFESFG